jgi:hypothetical protein
MLQPPAVLDRFTVTTADGGPTPLSQPIRSAYVEECWLPFLGCEALMFARKCDEKLSRLKDGAQSFNVMIATWASDLGMLYPEQVIAAKNRLIRFGLATWGDKAPVLSLKRHWPPVPEAIATPEHRALLLAIPDLPLTQQQLSHSG